MTKFERIADHLSSFVQVTMPFRYMRDPHAPATAEPQPLLPPGMREHIKADLDRGFDF